MQMHGGDLQRHFSDAEIANSYFTNKQIKIKELAQKSGRSIGEVYRIVYKYGKPNRREQPNYESIYQYASSGLSANKIAEFTGYTPRNIRYILKNKLAE